MGILVALITGAVIGLLYSMCVLRFEANQSVIGIGLNIIASGLSAVIVKFIWKKEGMSGVVNQMSTYSIPILRNIPVIGAFFTDQSPFILLTLVIALLSSHVVWKTKVGLRLQAIGENPLAAKTAGIPVERYRMLAIVTGSCLSALGGAYLSVVHSNLFVNNMVAGRGFIAIAANILGGWNPIGSLLASLLFAFTQTLRFQFSAVHIPDQVSQMIPYIITLACAHGSRAESQVPGKIGSSRMSRMFLRHGIILTIDETDDYYPDGCIVVENGKITYIGSDALRPNLKNGDTIINLSGKLVMPGLINTHIHSHSPLFRNFGEDVSLQTWLNAVMWPAESHLTEDQALLRGSAYMRRVYREWCYYICGPVLFYYRGRARG